MSEPQIVSFRRMQDGTKADYDMLGKLEAEHAKKLPGRVLRELQDLAHGLSGYAVDRLEHSLISATMAERDGADLDWIVTALIHDIGDNLAPSNHDGLAAMIGAPYLREECTWVMKTHGIFQLKYYGHHTGADPDAREKFKGHPSYQTAIDFCEHWDQTAFDPDFKYQPLSHFEPMLQEVFTRPAWDKRFTRPGERVGLGRTMAAAAE